MVKAEIRSLIANLLPRFDKTTKYHPLFIDASIERVLIEMYQELFTENPLALQRFTKGYGYTTPLAVLLEAGTGIYYTTLPASIIPFRDKASGVRRVSTIVRSGLTFFPVDARETDLLLSGSYADYITSKIGYLVTDTRVEYYNMSGVVLGQGVRMDCIVPFSVYAETDTVFVPEKLNHEAPTFIERVLAVLGVVQPVDQLDNNKDLVRQMNNGN